MISSGDLKSLGSFWTNLARNQRYADYVEEEDFLTFTRRLHNEGITFLVSTLPSIGKALDNFHATSVWETPNGWKSQECEPWMWVDELQVIQPIQLIPEFLGKAVKLAKNGDSVAVDCVRQLTLVFYKLEVEHDKEKVSDFLEKFVKTDQEIGTALASPTPYGIGLLERMRSLIGRILCNTDPLHIRPRHGSGATACHTPNWEKYHRFSYYEKLDAVYPYSEYFFLSPTHLADELEKLEEALVVDVPRARVCLVPKDSRGPRVISCEPAELMFIQQGIMSLLYATIESHQLTAGRVNFADQSINRQLARLGSLTGDLATIDLSDASDRVSLELVRAVFPPNWSEALEACRSEETILPNGLVVKLNKFAPMGSACCFPVEALIFWACVASATGAAAWTRSARHRTDIYVYGDDIIVPSNSYEEAVRGLEEVGLLVNLKKSYWKGPFRESCGGDYHNGNDVTPVMLRQFLSKSRTSLATNADLANSLVAKFGYETVSSLISLIEVEGDYIYPRSELMLPASIQHVPCASNDVFFRRRWRHDFQRWEHRTLALVSSSKERQAPGWGELLRMQLSKDRFNSSSSNIGNDDAQELSSEGNARNRYRNWVAISDGKLGPGWYTDIHSVETKWVWTWLGEPSIEK